MRIQKQLFLHNPEEGVWGDCHRTAIACVLDMDAKDVPHFADEDNADFNRDVEVWLNDRGITQINVLYPGSLGLQDVLYTMAAVNPGLVYLLGGTSRTGCGHTVVCKDDQIVCDPSLTDSGIIGPMKDGYYWITFFGSKVARAA